MDTPTPLTTMADETPTSNERRVTFYATVADRMPIANIIVCGIFSALQKNERVKLTKLVLYDDNLLGYSFENTFNNVWSMFRQSTEVFLLDLILNFRNLAFHFFLVWIRKWRFCCEPRRQ